MNRREFARRLLGGVVAPFVAGVAAPAAFDFTWSDGLRTLPCNLGDDDAPQYWIDAEGRGRRNPPFEWEAERWVCD